MPNIPSAVIGLGSAMMIMPGLRTLSIRRPRYAGEDVRLVGDDVDAVHLGGARLHAVLAEETAGEPHVVGGVAV
jgi:hypothetical protein